MASPVACHLSRKTIAASCMSSVVESDKKSRSHWRRSSIVIPRGSTNNDEGGSAPAEPAAGRLRLALRESGGVSTGVAEKEW